MALERRQALSIGAAWLATALSGARAGPQAAYRLSRRDLARRERAADGARTVPASAARARAMWKDKTSRSITAGPRASPTGCPALPRSWCSLEPDVLVTMGPAPAFAAKRRDDDRSRGRHGRRYPGRERLDHRLRPPRWQRDRNQLVGRRGLRQAPAAPQGAGAVDASRRSPDESSHGESRALDGRGTLRRSRAPAGNARSMLVEARTPDQFDARLRSDQARRLPKASSS